MGFDADTLAGFFFLPSGARRATGLAQIYEISKPLNKCALWQRTACISRGD
jgi:hypothetical protein